MSLPIADIAIGERVGFFDAVYAAHLGESIATEGQHDPIHVKRNGNAGKAKWTLVAGLHRLRGAEGIGHTNIDAIKVASAGATDAELQRLELSENLDHRQRRPIELATIMAARAGLEEGKDYPGRVGERPQVRAGRARQAASVNVTDAAVQEISQPVAIVAGWRERTAAALGCSLSKLEKYGRLHRAIVQELPDEAWRSEGQKSHDLPQRLNFHPLGASFKAMDRLAVLNPVARLIAAKAILSRPDWRSIEDVLVTSGLEGSKGGKPSPDDREARILSNWDRMSLRARRGTAIRLAETLPPTIAVAMTEVFKSRGLLP